MILCVLIPTGVKRVAEGLDGPWTRRSVRKTAQKSPVAYAILVAARRSARSAKNLRIAS